MKKQCIIAGCLLIFALISPVILAALALILSPYISTIVFLGLIFFITVIIAWKGKIGRK